MLLLTVVQKPYLVEDTEIRYNEATVGISPEVVEAKALELGDREIAAKCCDQAEDCSLLLFN